MNRSLPNTQGDFFKIDSALWNKGVRASRRSERKRIILPIHRQQEALVQRMLNFLQPGTYIRPHKHPLEGATETLVLLQGKIRFYIFDKKGKIKWSDIIEQGTFNSVMDIEPEIWHTFLVLDNDTVLFESKRGPYNPETDKIFAEWAPEEGSDDVENWMNGLKSNPDGAEAE